MQITRYFLVCLALLLVGCSSARYNIDPETRGIPYLLVLQEVVDNRQVQVKDILEVYQVKQEAVDPICFHSGGILQGYRIQYLDIDIYEGRRIKLSFYDDTRNKTLASFDTQFSDLPYQFSMNGRRYALILRERPKGNH